MIMRGTNERGAHRPPNNTFDRAAGSHSLAAAGQRERSPHSRGDRGVAAGSIVTAWRHRRDGGSQGLNP
jgi:hypothetical protein